MVDNLPESQQTIVPVNKPDVELNVPPDVLCPIPPPIVTPKEQYSFVGDWIIFLCPPPINAILVFVILQ